jgi:four helix bundle protein
MSEQPKSVSSLVPIAPPSRRFRFEHHGLDAFEVALEALEQGDAIVRSLPRGYGTLADQLRRALQGAYLQTIEAVARSGADRLSRFRCARAEAGEAAGALEAIARLGLAAQAEVDLVLELLWRLCAMLHRLGKLRR